MNRSISVHGNDALRVVRDPVKVLRLVLFSRTNAKGFFVGPWKWLACNFENDGDMDICLSSSARPFCAARMKGANDGCRYGTA